MERPAAFDLWRHRYAAACAGATVLLLAAGGLVTSTGSGLAVPDWPLSFGTVFPPMTGGVLFEHGHRLVAAAVGLMTVVLAGWFGRRERRDWVRRLAYVAAAGPSRPMADLLDALTGLEGVQATLRVVREDPEQLSAALAARGNADAANGRLQACPARRCR